MLTIPNARAEDRDDDLEVMTAGEVAAVLRVAETTVYTWIREGRLPAWRVGRSVRIPASAFRRLLAKSLTTAA